MHAGVEHGLATLAVGLRAVHGDVGVAQDGLRRGIGLGEGDPDRRVDEQLALRDLERRAQGLVHALGDERGLVGVGHAVEQDGELVAAEAGDRVRRPDGRLEPAGDRHEQPVSRLVAERVVDELEAVEVEEEHGGGRLRGGALRPPDRLVEAVEEEHAVGQAGQRVVHRVVLQAPLGLLAGGDVGLAADHARGLPGVVAHRGPAGEHPAVRAVPVLDPVLLLEVLRGARAVCLEGLLKRGAIVLVDAAQPLSRPLSELLVGVPEHRLPAGREVHRLALHVPVPEAVVGALQGERMALLGRGELPQRALAHHRVAEFALEQIQARDQDARFGRGGLGGRVGRVVEQQDGRGSAGAADPSRGVEVLDEVGVVRRLLEGFCGRGDERRRVAGAGDGFERAADRLLQLLGAHDEQRDGGHGRSCWGGSAAASSQ